MESWVNFSGKEGHQNIQPSTRPGIEQDWEAEILPLRQPLRYTTWNTTSSLRRLIV